MTTEALKSGAITNRDATPAVLSRSDLVAGQLREAYGSVTTTSSVTTGSTYIMCSVPSYARVSEILLSTIAMGGSSAADLGVYQTTANGGAVVDADFFAAALTLVSALTNSQISMTQTVNTITKQGQPLWQALGLSADSNRDYDIVFTTTATITTGGLLGVKVRYTV
jgi:hypothetical protein